MDTAQWPQEIVVKPIEEIVTNTCPKPLRPPPPPPAQPPAAGNSTIIGGGGVERKARPQKDHALNCPRCNSTNTKFCYYNNYSLTQPRYFCKTCRRYWTEGGSLRNIPVGGGSRKNKRPSSSSSSNPPAVSKKQQITSQDHHHHHLIPTTTLTVQNPKFHETQDLNLGFPNGYRSNFTEFVHSIGNGGITNNKNKNTNNNNNNPLVSSSCSTTVTTTPSTLTTSHQVSALDLLSNNNNSFMGLPVHHHQDPSGFGSNISMQDFKPTTLLGFSLDGISGASGFHQLQEENVNGRLLFPFDDLKLPVSSSTSDIDQKQGDNSAGYWTGMLSGGGSW